ncbi:MAG: prepilin-type N-terminal cleavage/methylation domain-containing protein [Candidatus Lloydbacteria bacterium]|nr:prepilin-type N-terminal cleavage/methylation domain-containing protein [Candidatus Lloydbacteria bacterium]
MQKKNKGFTLIELLVVIAIIGILSSVVLASLNTARQKSRDAKRVADIKQLQLALELYFDANRAYPTATNGLVSDLVSALVTPGYIPSLPADPLNTGVYVYKYTGISTGCLSYHMGTQLEGISNTVLASRSSGTSGAAAGTACTGSGADFGTAANDGIYDAKP